METNENHVVPFTTSLDIAKLLLRLQENFRMTQAGVPLVCDTLTGLLENILKSSKAPLQEALSATIAEVERVSTMHKLNKYLIDSCGHIPAEEIVLEKQEKINSTRTSLDQRLITAQNVPFRNSLQQILNVKELQKYVFGAIPTFDGIYKSATDGSIVQSHPHVVGKKNCFIIQMYFDDVEVVNPLGSRTKVHKQLNIYFTVLNFPDHVRSNLKSISLLASAKATHIKEVGFSKLLEDFLQTMKCLESSEGLNLLVDGEMVKFHGFLACTIGDSLALNVFGGFKDGIGFAKFPCRSCLTSKDDMKKIFCEEKMTLRDKQTHAEHIRLINSCRTIKEREKLSTEFGVCGDCELSQLTYFDVTKCFPQDLMHDLLEGVAEVETRALLRKLIVEEKFLTFELLNYNLDVFKYPTELKCDKPSIIEQHHVVDGHLRQKASQMYCLVVVLPFILAQFVPQDNAHFQNFMLLGQILNTGLAYEISAESVSFLRFMIECHHKRFVTNYPDVSVTPKFHFLVHLPSYIEKFGPARGFWCMRMEARHSFFANAARTTNNFKNIELTLAQKFQRHRTLDLDFGNPDAVVLGARSFSYADTRPFNMRCSYGAIVAKVLGGDNIVSVDNIKIRNFELVPGSVVLVEEKEDDLPKFCQISDILLTSDQKCGFLLRLFETLSFDQMRNVYCVKLTTKYMCMPTFDLPTIQPFPIFKDGENCKVLLQFYDRNEFCG